LEQRNVGPFTLLSSREVYSNPWIRLREDRVIRPGGSTGLFGVIEMRSGSTVLALDEQQHACLVREFKYAVARESLELISGGLDNGESPLEAARRELREEAGLEAAEWIDLGVVDPFTTVVRSPNHMFLAVGVSPAARQPDEGEVLELVRVPLAELVEMVMRSEITHAATCVAVLKAARRSTAVCAPLLHPPTSGLKAGSTRFSRDRAQPGPGTPCDHTGSGGWFRRLFNNMTLRSQPARGGAAGFVRHWGRGGSQWPKFSGRSFGGNRSAMAFSGVRRAAHGRRGFGWRRAKRAAPAIQSGPVLSRPVTGIEGNGAAH
jgi:ADP-ribose pyrophosphatase